MFRQLNTLTAQYAWLVVAVLLVYLGIAMSVALFSKDNGRAERARGIFTDLLRLFWWWRSR